MKTNILPVLLITILSISCSTKEPKYEANYESLSQHKEAPEWFTDAKFGIYFHWGVYSVPAYGSEWYPRWMHFEESDIYNHHVETYGHPSEFGYHDFVPDFKAEYFDAREWVSLFKEAGAQFAGPVAEHHDGFSMWESEITPWNAADKGPERDILGELAEELRANDMKLITTFHHARNLQRHNAGDEENYRHQYRDSHYPFFEGMPPTSDDAELKYLYGNIPEEQWNEEVWFGKLKEVIDKYQPDIIWFDSWLDKIPEEYRQQFAAYYLNEAGKWNKEVVIVRKQDDLPLTFSVDDLEKSRKNKIEEKVWMTDETISYGSWCYTEGLKIKPTKDVLHVLIDIVSKNGILLLNVSPKADGTIPQEQQNVLREIGGWLADYGESIYGTKPWFTFGEGPTKEPEGHFKNHKAFEKIVYTNEDIRYTTKEDIIYAFVFGKPMVNTELIFSAFAELEEQTEVSEVELLGTGLKLDFNNTKAGLAVQIPEAEMNEMATVFKIYTK